VRRRRQSLILISTLTLALTLSLTLDIPLTLVLTVFRGTREGSCGGMTRWPGTGFRRSRHGASCQPAMSAGAGGGVGAFGAGCCAGAACAVCPPACGPCGLSRGKPPVDSCTHAGHRLLRLPSAGDQSVRRHACHSRQPTGIFSSNNVSRFCSNNAALLPLGDIAA